MKLPEDRNERIKVLAMMSIGALAVAYALITGVFAPLTGKKTKQLEQITAKEQDLEKAQGSLSKVARNRLLYLKKLKEVSAIMERPHLIIQPRLGNYLLEATEIIEEQAKAAGVTLDSVSELGVSALPSATTGTAQTDRFFKTFHAAVRGNGGLHNLVALLRSLEEDNPYLTIVKLDIVSNREAPQTHRIAFEVQWPVWSDPTAPERIYSDLQELTVQTNAANVTPTGIEETEEQPQPTPPEGAQE